MMRTKTLRKNLEIMTTIVFLLGVFLGVAFGGNEKNAYIKIIINPPEIRSQARWFIPGVGGENESGETVTVNLQQNTIYTVQFTNVDGYQTPENITTSQLHKEDIFEATGEYLALVTSPDENVTVDDLSKWPIWPQKRSTFNVWEPSSFTSVGKDVVSWVVFDPASEGSSFWLSDLKVMVKTSETSFDQVSPDYDLAVEEFGYINDSQITEFRDQIDLSASMLSDLRTHAVIPLYDRDWMTYAPESGDIEYYANQDFVGNWFSYEKWRSYLWKCLGEGKELQDSGHAPPLTMWAKDNWLVNYVQGYEVPSGWMDGDEEKVFIFLPTNQGMLNCFEVDDLTTDPGVERVWSVMPFPAFQQAVYSQVRYANESPNEYSRMTLLDGPVYVHDVQDSSGSWKRVLVGSTGLGTEQVNKIGQNWITEGAKEPSGAPAITDSSRIFGIYAIDVTNPYEPVPLWSVTNIHCPRSEGATVSRVDVQDAPNGNINVSNYPDNVYQDIDYMTSKPQIGFTEDADGNRTWHLLMVAVDKDGKYRWINADPMTGEVITEGYFEYDDAGTMTKETLPVEVEGGFNYEDWYPSRVLAAYPPEGGLPVLSNVYVFLSNGTFYSWNLNDSGMPEKIFYLYTNTEHENVAPPITDFDISYMGDRTYLALTAPMTYPGEGQTHDTSGLLVVDLTLLQSNTGIESLNMQGGQGQDGDVKFLVGDYGVVVVQLQTSNTDYTDDTDDNSASGSNAYDFEDLVAAPLFVSGTLYQALYSTEGEMSRLYTLDLWRIIEIFEEDRPAGQEWFDEDLKNKVAEAYTAYIDDGDQFAAMTIDSEGYLVILSESGEVLQRISVVDSGDFGAGGVSSLENLDIVYWKID